MDELLKIEDLHIHYETDLETVLAVNGISFAIREGETLGLVGETGAGKTTAGLGIMRLVPDPPGRIVSGRILYKGEDLLKKSSFEMRKISMIFQDPMTALNPVLTVGDQIAEVIRRHEGGSAREADEKAKEMLKMVGILPERSGEYPHQFSGGMKQRVMIAIALACNPRLLIADEPTTALDVTIQAQVLKMIRSLRDQMGTSMLLITHDLGVVAECCDKVAVMYAGEIVEIGSLRDIFKNTEHPYTIGLFQSIPGLDDGERRLKPIPGQMADPSDLPSGCVFHPRCSMCMEKCRTEHPELVEGSPGHFSRCHVRKEERYGTDS